MGLKNTLNSYFIKLSLLLFFLGTQNTNLQAETSQARKYEKTILLTGAAGFIGSNFLEYMFYKYPHYEFFVLDSLTYAGSLDNISEEIKSSSRFKFFYGSVTNQKLVDYLMEKVDFVVHFAAESHVSRSIYDASVFFETDVIGTRVLMDSLVTHKNIERFIHISTSEVCGTAETVPMNEEHPINPRSPYAAAKAGADRLVYAYQATYDIPTIIIRPFNNYGPKQHLEKMLPRFISSAIKGDVLTVHGDGLQTRDWMHVKDTCRALDIVLHHPDFALIKNHIFHIGSGKETSVLEIALLTLKFFDLPADFIKFVTDRPGQVRCHISSNAKAKELLGWEPTITIQEGFESIAQWYIENRQWCEKREFMQHVPINLNNKIELQ